MPPMHWTASLSHNGIWALHGPTGHHFANLRVVALENSHSSAETEEDLALFITRAPELLSTLRDAQGLFDTSDVRHHFAIHGESAAMTALLNRMRLLLRSLAHLKA